MHYGTVNDVLDAVVSLSILREDGTEDTFEFIMGGEFLIGMGLLRGSNLNVDTVPGDSVTITELPALS